MGTGYWSHNFPYSRRMPRPGVFVIGWHLIFQVALLSVTLFLLILKRSHINSFCCLILRRTLGPWGCLMIVCASLQMVLCFMKEYGIKESWTKLYTIRAMGNHDFDPYTKVVYISEDDQFLIDFYERTSSKMELGVCDSKIGTLKFPMIQNINGWMGPEIYAEDESLISPCS